MQTKVVKLDPRDNLIIALTDLHAGEEVALAGESYTLVTDVAAKHKFAARISPLAITFSCTAWWSAKRLCRSSAGKL